jgi:deazaflavin-dependent oxidoreductase (nitroreductase family)
MSFKTPTPNGTRGRRQPGTGGPIGRWMTKRVMNRIRRKGKMPGLGFNALVLTTIGRKSGIQRQTPVGWFPGQDDSWLIVASAIGAARNPAWYYNLAAHPDQVWIETPGGKVAVTAQRLHGTERDQAWQQITAAAPRFANYQQATDRELPIIRLVPRAS